jgi:hypothetical protein
MVARLDLPVGVGERGRESVGVRGNARLTGSAGAVIFVFLAAEGITIPSVQRLLTAHVFIGMLLIPIVALKMGTTIYRFYRYYRGDLAYTRKGPPAKVLRLLGPVVVVLTIAVFGTGVGAITAGPSSWIVTAHKASFVLWFGAMTVHVLGHIRETPALALADWQRRTRREATRSLARITLLSATIAVGLGLAVISLGWIGAWRH